MKQIAIALSLALLLGSCTHQDLKAPCKHPSLALFVSNCGPLEPVNR